VHGLYAIRVSGVCECGMRMSRCLKCVKCVCVCVLCACVHVRDSFPKEWESVQGSGTPAYS
jgi:hypothetical protein